ncbi:MAG TPA: serine hydrolase [Thermoanaerobaculia bacterium]|nr:serine hydrolase [Thermoanaerobaculia bacterium]
MTLLLALLLPQAGTPVLPSDAEIRKVLAEWGGAEGEGVGVVVGVVEPQGTRVIAYGRIPLDGDTVFEIGSVTKVFTALLLADMAGRGEVSLTDAVVKHLPSGVKIPERNGRAITLLDLATHTSGLPFMPADAQLYQFLARYELPREIGAEREYSNLGYWLLGEALASKAGMDFESLLRKRVLAPLKLESTAITLSPQLQARLAAGHDASLQPSPLFSAVPVYSLMPAAGGAVSTVNDLARLLRVAMGYDPSPFTQAPQALAWTEIAEGDGTLIFHDGGTFGYASSVAWDPKKRVGVVVLSNQVAGVGEVARHLLRPDLPLPKATVTKRTEIALDPAVLDSYAGRYEAPGEGVFVIGRERDFLTIQLPADWGLPKLRLRPESRRDFFVAELPLRVTFQPDGILVHPPRGQRAVPAIRTGSIE